MGECFFWYRLTRFVPDKFHRAVKRLCVCVCDCRCLFVQEFNVTIIRLTLVVESSEVWILQGEVRALISNETLSVQTNGNRSAIKYSVTSGPLNGQLWRDFEPVTGNITSVFEKMCAATQKTRKKSCFFGILKKNVKNVRILSWAT